MFKHGHSAFGSAGGEDDEIFLNLTPMIDILTCLLFFLLLSFGAVIIALINASVPVQAEGEGDPNVSKLRVTMGISITDKGMLATASHDSMSKEELDKLRRAFPKTKDYDYKGLHEFMWKIKNKFPNSTTVVITPKPRAGITYEVLVKTMDATRERAGGTKARPIKVPMFPEAVVSTLVE